MLNGKFIATRSYKSGEWLTKGKVYEFVNGVFTFDDGCYDSYTSIFDFENIGCECIDNLIPYTEPQPFTKQSLKDGYAVEYESGVQLLVLTKTGTLHDVYNGTIKSLLNHYSDELSHNPRSGYNIMKVYDTEDNLIWEREIYKSLEQIEIERLESDIQADMERLLINKAELRLKLEQLNK